MDFQTDPLPIIAASPDDAAFHTCRFNADWLQVILGVVEDVLQNRESWDSDDEAELDEMQSKVDQLINQLSTEVSAMTQTVGDVVMFAGDTLPAGRLWCDGQTYNRVDYPELYDAIDAQYTIDANTFKVPDFQDRSPMGASVTHPPAARRGAETHTLTIDEMPAHNHKRGDGIPFLLDTVSNPAASEGTWVSQTDTGFWIKQRGFTQLSGGDQPHNNVHPVEHVRFCIIASP